MPVSLPRHDPADPQPWVRIGSPGRIHWHRVNLPIHNLPAALSGMRLLHLTDIHINRYWYKAYDNFIARVADARLDLICITGDLIDNRWNPTRSIPLIRRFLDGLQSRLGSFAILGNHDGDLLAQHLAPAKCTLLHGRRATLNVAGGRLEIIGLPGVARRDTHPRLLRRVPDRTQTSCRIALAHFPDQIHKLQRLNPDLVLTGHTHGGQVCLPGGGPIITHDSLPKAQSRGVFQIGRSWLVVSRGIGFATYPVRLFAPPEVIEITLTPV